MPNFQVFNTTPYQGLKMKPGVFDLRLANEAINHMNNLIIQQGQADADANATVTKLRESLPESMAPYLDEKLNAIFDTTKQMIQEGNPHAALKYSIAQGKALPNDQNIINGARNWKDYNDLDDANRKMVDGEHVTQREYDYWKETSGVFDGHIEVDENGNEVYVSWDDKKPLLRHQSKQEKAFIAKQLLTATQTGNSWTFTNVTPGSSESVTDDKGTASSTKESFTTGRSGHNNTTYLSLDRIKDLFKAMNVDLEPIRQEFNALKWEQNKYIKERNELLDKKGSGEFSTEEEEKLNQLNYLIGQNNTRLYNPQGLSYADNLYEWMARECIGWEEALVIHNTDTASGRVDKNVVTGKGKGKGAGGVLPSKLPFGPQPGMATNTEDGTNVQRPSYNDADALFEVDEAGKDPNSYEYAE